MHAEFASRSVRLRPAGLLGLNFATFRRTRPIKRLGGQHVAASRGSLDTRQRRTVVQVDAFSAWNAFKAAGLTQPSWVPDFGQAERKAVLDSFFASPIRREVYETLLDDGFRMTEQLRQEAGHSRTYGKADWIELMCNSVAPAIPDFNWSAATDGKADADAYALVVVKVSGHHTHAPFSLPGLPPIQPSGRRVTLEEQMMRVRVEGGRIKEIIVLPSEGAGPAALYAALGGEAVERM